MKLLNAIHDPIFIKPQKYSTTERFFLKLIRDERDLPFIVLTLKISLTVIPLAVLLYMPFVQGWVWWLVAAVYAFITNFVFKGSFGLMLHCTSHRVLFKKKYKYLNHYLPWVIAPFFGHSPETYFTHHIGMHHAENNLEDDESSTMPFQRDSIKDFSIYYLKFLFRGVYDLATYFFIRKRKKLMVRSVRGESLFILLCIGMSFVSLKATLWVFIIPMIIYRLVAMMGNWAQHSFVDAADPGNEYKNSITCINTRYNVKCWNDGYHISHHEKQTMHWTEHPLYFKKTLQTYISNDAIVFDGIHFLHVFMWLMRKRYDLLAKNFVLLDGQSRTQDETIAFLKSRTRKFV